MTGLVKPTFKEPVMGLRKIVGHYLTNSHGRSTLVKVFPFYDGPELKAAILEGKIGGPRPNRQEMQKSCQILELTARPTGPAAAK